jgi:hypothetical protein
MTGSRLEQRPGRDPSTSHDIRASNLRSQPTAARFRSPRRLNRNVREPQRAMWDYSANARDLDPRVASTSACLFCATPLTLLPQDPKAPPLRLDHYGEEMQNRRAWVCAACGWWMVQCDRLFLMHTSWSSQKRSCKSRRHENGETDRDTLELRRDNLRLRSGQPPQDVPIRVGRRFRGLRLGTVAESTTRRWE